MRHAVISLAVASSILLMSAAGAHADSRVVTEDSPADLAVRKQLAAKVKKVAFEQVPLKDALQWVRDHGVNIQVNWQALQLQGVDKTTEVTVHLKDVTLARALEVILAEASGTEPLETMIDGGVVVISTPDDLSRRTLTRLYTVADLICSTHPAFDGAAAPWSSMVFLGVPRKAKQPVVRYASNRRVEPYVPGPEASADATIELLKNIVDPESWETGDAAVMNSGPTLIITQTQKNHENIRKLIEALRERKEQDEVRIGLAMVRLREAEAVKAVREIASKGGDVAKALEKGEEKGLWTLDRCSVQVVEIGRVLAATQVRRFPDTEPAAEEDNEEDNEYLLLGVEALEFEEEEEPPARPASDEGLYVGYEVGVLPIGRREGKVYISVAAASAWLDGKNDAEEAEPDLSAGVMHRHNVFDFTLAPGEVKRIPIIPAAARDGAVEIIVWLPEAKKE